MFRVIEITRGSKPVGNVIKFGGTSEMEFYIEAFGNNDTLERWPQDKVNALNNFTHDVRKIIDRKNFEFAESYLAYAKRIGFDKCRKEQS